MICVAVISATIILLFACAYFILKYPIIDIRYSREEIAVYIDGIELRRGKSVAQEESGKGIDISHIGDYVLKLKRIKSILSGVKIMEIKVCPEVSTEGVDAIKARIRFNNDVLAIIGAMMRH